MKQRKKKDKLLRYFKFRNVNGALVPFSRDPVQVYFRLFEAINLKINTIK